MVKTVVYGIRLTSRVHHTIDFISNVNIDCLKLVQVSLDSSCILLLVGEFMMLLMEGLNWHFASRGILYCSQEKERKKTQ